MSGSDYKPMFLPLPWGLFMGCAQLLSTAFGRQKQQPLKSTFSGSVTQNTMWECGLAEAALVLTYFEGGAFQKEKLSAPRARICIRSKEQFILGIISAERTAVSTPPWIKKALPPVISTHLSGM